jgi:uncharacterized membrane protein required for colicin V production
MITIVAIAVALFFAVIGIRMGYFRVWVMLFNILVSIYLAVMLAPVVPGLIPYVRDFRYRYPAFIIVAAIIIFAVLHSIAISLMKTFEASCHRIFDLVSSAVLGFISGYLLTAFVFFIICLIPLEKPWFVSWQDKSTAKAGQPVISACDFIGYISIHACEDAAGGVVHKLIDERNELAGLHQEEEYDTEESYE